MPGVTGDRNCGGVSRSRKARWLDSHGPRSRNGPGHNARPHANGFAGGVPGLTEGV